MDKFLVRLRQQARHRNFGTLLDDNLKDRLIEKLMNMELKRASLETRNITLTEVLEKARASEAFRQQITFIDCGANVNTVGKIKKAERTEDQAGKLCYSGGKKGHFSRDSCCPAKKGNAAKVAERGQKKTSSNQSRIYY